MKRTRGMALTAVMLAVIAVTGLIMIGLAAREADLNFQDRSRCRAAARWAAESAIARGRAAPSRPSISGKLEGASYTLSSQKQNGLRILTAEGVCQTKTHLSKKRIEVHLVKNQVVRWIEPIAP